MMSLGVKKMRSLLKEYVIHIPGKVPNLGARNST